ncbi:indolepyruvate ferredoxin oxidoreductase family protein [Phreatobacter sp. AB_2022a]|uniref:indolepyruvate ferredoxin oxidoreductase family protein n=1 Tax=Phreatobacter sp. AB_2022a TaxID=3003134 RepID=UPI002286E87B|nr:indolepyruvate ferredoxin oxidoreductase family protein [Phreatobacter sp. AB_2022a]MCZ0736776.1 indolepyruvate ferredoxin oxidoreductase family protein [Phreatobacter sp. AB_2022a]
MAAETGAGTPAAATGRAEADRPNALRLDAVSLDDKYDLTKKDVFITGVQALVRLTLMQKERDRLAGLNTAGFVSGYRGSPLGGLDQQFFKAQRQLIAQDIVFTPGLNEDLAATAVWGSQQAEMRGEGKYDGVFGIWYGKGPGVDRSGDVFRHANLAGSARYGGVLCLMGDDHTAESSTVAHQSEFHFVDVMMPILNPAGAQEILDYGLYGWALSRYSGNWVALKCMKDTVESTGVVDGSVDRVKIVIPSEAEFAMPPGGLSIRPNDDRNEQELRLHMHKRAAALAFVRANKINRIVTTGGRNPKIGIITTGKSYLDTRQAFDELGLDEVKANDLGIRLFKIGCTWPLDPGELRSFAEGLDLIIVVEEKRSLIEVQVREELYGSAHQPVVIGKKDETGEWLFPVHGALDPNDVAICIGERILKSAGHVEEIAAAVQRLRQAQEVLKVTPSIAARLPYFCSGCPHNTSTVVPEGMRAYAGIGCHYMALWMDRNTEGFTQMGGEGANWVGEAPFSRRGHVFQNLGDGTYNHSGYLAIRFAVAAKANITYKILFNDAVAMTGGQPHEGTLTVPMIAAQLRAEGIERIAVVSDEPDKYGGTSQAFPAGTSFSHRDDLAAVQTELAGIAGVTALIYDQTCAAEKRRRRKRGTFPDPVKRVIINESVCEGCGDCGVQSNCVSIQPVETEFGRKRTIDQSSCNKDFSCAKGFCPSFVTVHGAEAKKGKALQAVADISGLPDPVIPEIGHTYNVLIAGIGGTGIVTVGAILGMACHIEKKGVGLIDMAGLAQKGGEVFSHMRIARKPEDIHSIRVHAGSADLVLSGDIVIAGGKKALASMRPETKVVVNTAEMLPGQFTRNADFSLPSERLKRAIVSHASRETTHLVDAQRLATALMGNSIASNLFLVGYAYQIGALPLSAEAIERAIELNGEAVKMNVTAFRWGRIAAHDLARVEALVRPATAPLAAERLSETLDEAIARRVTFLTAYQNAAYAARYADLVARVRAREAAVAPDRQSLAEAVARYLFKLMAYKDEYEVARLYTDGTFAAQVAKTFDGDNLRYEFHLAPPLFARKDPHTGLPRKTSFGPVMMKGFRILAKLKGLRGTPFDIFGYSEERRTERQLIADYEALVAEILDKLTPENHAVAVGLAAIPEKIRGFGHVKARHLAAAKAEEANLIAAFRGKPEQAARLAAE